MTVLDQSLVRYRAPRHARIFGATVATCNLDAAVNAYAATLGYQTFFDGKVSGDLARSWGTPEQEGSRQIVLQPESGAQVHLRFVELPSSAPPAETFRTWGWAAHEVCVQDVDRICLRLEDGPFRIYGRPAHLEFGAAFRPMQAIGPAGEGIFLTQCSADTETFDLPRAQSEVDQVFIMVLASRDLDASAAFYGSELGLEPQARFDLPYKTINRSFGLAEDTRHEVALMQAGREVVVEADRYPDLAGEAEVDEGYLKQGIAMVSLLVDPARLSARLGGALQSKAFAPGTDVYGSRTTSCVRGPSGEVVELVSLVSGEV